MQQSERKENNMDDQNESVVLMPMTAVRELIRVLSLARNPDAAQFAAGQALAYLRLSITDEKERAWQE